MSKTRRRGGGEHNQPGFHGVLRLVEDDTAALHFFKRALSHRVQEFKN